jgi:hypothetical protein
VSTPGDDDPPGGSPPPPSPLGTTDAPVVAPAPEPSIVIEPGLTPLDAADLVSDPTPGSIGRPFAPSSDTDSILPDSLGDDALAAAVGVTPPKKPSKPSKPNKRAKKRESLPELDDDGNPPGKSRKTMIVIGAAVVAGVGISALVLLGRVNSERYFMNCTAKEAIAEQGRAFPPWGSKQLFGAQWRAIPLPPNAQCKSEELDTRDKLEEKFLALLVDRTSAQLDLKNFVDTAPGDAKAAPLDAIAGQLEQALLLSRAPERGDQRKQVERMLGDVQYWRASLRLRDANAALVEASRQFDAAALQRPMHVSDAGAWAELVRRVSDELRAGPAGAAAVFPPAPTGDPRSAAPQGTALPVEPAPSAGSDVPATPPDAGVPTGGVLL